MSIEHANQNIQLIFGMTVCFNCMLSNFECLMAKHTMTGTLFKNMFFVFQFRNTNYFLFQTSKAISIYIYRLHC